MDYAVFNDENTDSEYAVNASSDRRYSPFELGDSADGVSDNSEATSHDDEDDDFYVVSAPPPSPQEPSMLEAVFAEQLTRSLQMVVQPSGSNTANTSSCIAPHTTKVAGAASPPPSTVIDKMTWQHAHALDKLLRRQQDGAIRKKNRPFGRTKARSLCNKTASDLADAVSMIRISSSKSTALVLEQQKDSSHH
ncbi:hypothetical protein BCR43DRAFT_486107 [Syncephalastrum racemosum]|uniref:Uncharacterized protein n=1 Tax=Syncephalastrum racemosum TaxID=13706 RepID=A0A1X2HNI9_SYNRA|nr:hypothetical protein BCR43DRAFT_486107 [Syncephalastrum racemosum]